MAKITLSIIDVETDATGGKETINMSINGETIVVGECTFNCYYEDLPTKTGLDAKSDTGNVKFSVTVQQYSYRKQMYSPNEVTMLLQIAPQDVENYKRYAKVDHLKLKSAFCNKQVKIETSSTITDKNNKEVTYSTKDDDFYIQEITPVYRNDAMYVTMHLFSPDKILTLTTGNQTFVSKKLKSEILEGQIANFKLPYKNTTALTYNADNMKVLKANDKEHIFPYLVQYNESFYDFLARTTNRWGEFLYWENGKLNIGYSSDTSKTGTVKDPNSYTYVDISSSNENVEKFNSEAIYDEHVSKNILKKGEYDEVMAQLGSSKGWDVYIFKKVSELLSFDVNIYDWVVGTLVDDSVSLAKAEIRSKDKNDKFDDKYFKNPTGEHYDSTKSSYNQFSEHEAIVNDVTYLNVLKQEVAAARNAIVIDLDTTWQDLRLGQVIDFWLDKKGEVKQTFIIVKIEGTQPFHYSIENNKVKEITNVAKTDVTFKVTALAMNDKSSIFYPTVIPSGHVRKSDTQIAKVTSNDDPLRLNRVRIQYQWDANKEDTPWLKFATPTGDAKVGFQGRHHAGDKVLVSYHYGNIERPYVSGAVPEDVPVDSLTNDVTCCTPGGQAIKMTDGTGAGATALFSSLQPGMKFITGFFPATDWFTSTKADGSSSDSDNTVQSKFFEGGIELCDKYGIWSIKGSTDARNVTIQSAWGDVKINAFSGITISAPNGDVKIAGKNITLEAGNNLILKSGKNIKDKWYPTLMDYSNKASIAVNLAGYLPTAVAKKLAEMAFACIDITMLRTLWETFVKPVEGKLEIYSNRYLMLEAGGAEAAYPADAYSKAKHVKVDEDHRAIRDDLEKINTFIIRLTGAIRRDYESLRTSKKGLEKLTRTHSIADNENPPIEPWKSVVTIIDDLWKGKAVDDNLFGFKGKMEEINNDNADKIIKYWFPDYNAANVNQEQKDEYKNRVANKQQPIKTKVKQYADNLLFVIDRLQHFNYLDWYKNNVFVQDSKAKEVIKTDLLNNSPISAKLETSAVQEGITKPNDLFSAQDITKLRRKFFLAAVKKYGIVQYSAINKVTQQPATPVEAPDPYNDNIEDKWKEYVDSLWKMPAKEQNNDDEESVWKKILDTALLQPIKKNAKSWKELGKNTADHFAFGPADHGSILFTSKPGTLVLGEEIFRANTDFAEDVTYEGDENKTSGFVAEIREWMK